MKDYETAYLECPTCHVLTNRASNADGNEGAPRPGDWTVCAYCKTPAAITEDGLRPLTPEEQKEWDDTVDVAELTPPPPELVGVPLRRLS